MTISETSRFLVKFREPTARSAIRISARLGMSATAVSFASEPLFQSIGVTRGRGVAAGGGVWRLAAAPAKLEDGNPWDRCHAILAQNDSVMLVEPDLEQQWSYGERAAADHNSRMRSGGPLPQDIGDGYAGDKSDDYWFRNSKHGQFDAAITATGGIRSGRPYRTSRHRIRPLPQISPQKSSRRSRSQFRGRRQTDGRDRPVDWRSQ